jgi:hypothetical protein
MPMHDWTRVDAGIFHDFHGDWIQVLKHTLNNGVLPPDHYALSEQRAAGFGPDVLTLQETRRPPIPAAGGGTGLLTARPQTRIVGDSDMGFYRRKQNAVTVRHASDDRVVAVIEVVSPGNKNSRNPLRAFVEKAAELLDRGIHLLLLDPHPPGPHDPEGIHGAIWEAIDGRPHHHPKDKPLALVAYESDAGVRAYIEPVAVGDVLPEMPLFLVPGGHVRVPVEATYEAAWAGVPARWRRVIDPTA